MRQFDTSVVARQMVEALRPVLAAIERHDKDLARQARRSGPSAFLNVEEGARRRGKDRYFLYDVAAGSAAETRAAIECAIAMGYVTETAAEITATSAVPRSRDRGTPDGSPGDRGTRRGPRS